MTWGYSSNMPKITVITASVRKEGIPIVQKHLRTQTFKDFEHIIQGREGSMEGNYWTLNQDMNIAIGKAKGELIVSIQDYTAFKPDALEKFGIIMSITRELFFQDGAINIQKMIGFEKHGKTHDIQTQT